MRIALQMEMIFYWHEFTQASANSSQHNARITYLSSPAQLRYSFETASKQLASGSKLEALGMNFTRILFHS